MNPTATVSLDLEFIRAQFPAFSEPGLQGQAFFENAGGSYACAQVIDRLTNYYRKTKVQPYYAFPASTAAGEAMDSSYTSFANYLNVKNEEVMFGPSTSQNTYVLAQAMLGYLTEGDEIIVTNQDHEANSGAWRRLDKRGIAVREWQVNLDTAGLELTDLKSLISEKTKLITMPHCSNIVGEINPVKAVAGLAREVTALLVVDGVSYAGHGFPDIDALGADIYLFSLYKTYGPHQGVMVVRQRAAQHLTNQSHFFNGDYPRKRLVPAGPDHAQVAAAGGVTDYFDAVYAHHFGQSGMALEKSHAVHDLFRAAELERLAPLLDYLKQHPKIHIIGPDSASATRAPTVSIMIEGHKPADLVKQLAVHRVNCGNGDFYARRLVEVLGIDIAEGVTRFSFVHYTSEADVQQLIGGLEAIL